MSFGYEGGNFPYRLVLYHDTWQKTHDKKKNVLVVYKVTNLWLMWQTKKTSILDPTVSNIYVSAAWHHVFIFKHISEDF